MNQPSVVLIGGGGHSLVVAEAIGESVEIVGFFDDCEAAPLRARFGIDRLGPLSAIPPDIEAFYMLAFGNLPLRRTLLEGPLKEARTFGITHRTAFVSGSATIGRGVFVAPHAIVHSFATVADHAIINTGAIIEHECDIGQNAHIAPGAVLGGNVTVGPDTLLGIGSRVIPGIRIGARCTIGAGAVVVRDVPDDSTVIGVPGRVRA